MTKHILDIEAINHEVQRAWKAMTKPSKKRKAK